MPAPPAKLRTTRSTYVPMMVRKCCLRSWASAFSISNGTVEPMGIMTKASSRGKSTDTETPTASQPAHKTGGANTPMPAAAITRDASCAGDVMVMANEGDRRFHRGCAKRPRAEALSTNCEEILLNRPRGASSIGTSWTGRDPTRAIASNEGRVARNPYTAPTHPTPARSPSTTAEVNVAPPLARVVEQAPAVWQIPPSASDPWHRAHRQSKARLGRQRSHREPGMRGRAR